MSVRNVKLNFYHAKIGRNFVLPFSRFLHNSVLPRCSRKSGTMKKNEKKITDRYWFTCNVDEVNVWVNQN